MARKKKDAHHGGAWKVAYADFVTAMMALFMVLWIVAQDKKILLATSRYFQSPFNSPIEKSAGIMELNADSPHTGHGEDEGTDPDAKKKTSPTEVDLQFLNSIAKDFYKMLNMDEDLNDKPIDIQITSDGIKITMFDRARKPLFKEQTADFTDWGSFLMQSLSWLIDRHSLNVVIEGHTRSGIVYTKKGYTDWDLSTDRANAARRMLTYYAVDPALISRISGFAATRPVAGLKPEDEANQRITLSLAPSRGGRPIPPEFRAK